MTVRLLTWQVDQIGREIEERFIASSGPGGQNVNKVATAVQLRFNVLQSAAFGELHRARLERALANRLTEAGDLVFTVDTHRSQGRNREEARARLVAILEKGLERPRPRIATRPTRASKERRLDSKSRRSEIKRDRGRVDDD